MNIIEDGVNRFKTDPEINSSFRESAKTFIPHHYVNKLTIIFVGISIFLFTVTNIIFHYYFYDVKIKMGEDATVIYLDNNINLFENEKDLEFVYINDIHLDPKYIASSSMSSFCRKFDERFVQKPYYFGQYRCDLPLPTLRSMLRYINSKIYPKNSAGDNSRPSQPNFVLLGGDTVAHFLPFTMEQSHSFISEVVNNISISFNKNQENNVPILFVLGNNEYVPNYGSVNFSFDKKNFESLYKHVIGPYVIKDKDYVKSGYENFNPKNIKQIEHDQYVKEQKRTFMRGGYYYYDIPEAKLRILVMNTITYSHWRDIDGYNNRKIAHNDQDIDIQDQYDFLTNEEIDFLKMFSKTSKLDKDSRQNHPSDDEDESDDYINPNDPYGQFEWILESSRDAFENHNYTVAIALHIPPGSFYTDGNYSRISQGWKTSFIKRFDAVIAEANIEFIISAHSHFDLFLPINGLDGISKQYSIGAPALSPNHWNNPGFRIYKLSREGKLLDYDQYFANIADNPQPRFKTSPKSKSSGLKWQLDYSFKEAYSSKIYKEEEDELQENDDDNFDDVSDFDQYNFTSEVIDPKFNESEKDPHFSIKIQSKSLKKYTRINKDTIADLIKWASSTTEGRWAFKQRLMAHGEENGPFYKCLQTSTTVEQIYKCLGSLAPKVIPKQ